MILPLMPKATAVWLVENTTLTFEQIGAFCGMHALEVQGIADGEVAVGIKGMDPTASGQVTMEDIKRCEDNSQEHLHLAPTARQYLKTKVKGSRYTPVSRRQDKPEALAWLLKFHPYIPDSQLVKLIGTTKNTINAIKNRTHWNISNIKPKDPVILGLCSQTQLDETVHRYRPADQAAASASGE